MRQSRAGGERLVEPHHPEPAPPGTPPCREGGGQRPCREEHGDARVREHERQPLGRVGGIERHVGAARRQDGGEPHDQAERAFGADPHPHLRSHSQPAELGGQAPGASGELAVGERLPLEDHRHGGRGPRRLLAEESGEGDRAGDRGGPVPLDELLAFGRRQQREAADRPLGIRHGRPEQAFELAAQAGDRRGVEEVAVVLEDPGEPRRTLAHGEGEIELGHPGVQLHRSQLESGQRQRLEGRVLERQEDLEERRVRQAALRSERLDELLERQLLMGIGGQGVPSHPAEEVGERRFARQVGAESESVDEEPDQVLDLTVSTVGDRRPHHQVLLARPAPEEGLEAGEESHERRRSPGAAERLEAGGGRRRQPEGQARATVGLHRWAWPVGRQAERRGRPRQSLPPVRDLGRHPLAAQVLPLPEGEVGVLDRERRQRRGAAGGKGGIERPHLAHQDPRRPAVGDDVVEGPEGDVLRRGQTQQPGAEQGTAGEVERPPRLGPAQPLGLPVAHRLGEPREVGHRQRERRGRGRRDHLPRLPRHRLEARSQHLVPADDLPQARCEDGGESRPRQRTAIGML